MPWAGAASCSITGHMDRSGPQCGPHQPAGLGMIIKSESKDISTTAIAKFHLVSLRCFFPARMSQSHRSSGLNSLLESGSDKPIPSGWLPFCKARYPLHARAAGQVEPHGFDFGSRNGESKIEYGSDGISQNADVHYYQGFMGFSFLE